MNGGSEDDMPATSQKVEDGQEQVVGDRSTKSLGLFKSINLIIGIIMGSGIFTVVGETFPTFKSDSIGFVVVIWLISGVISMLGALVYAELGTKIIQTGGERAIYSHVLNRHFSSFFSFVQLGLIFPISITSLTITCSTYFMKTVVKGRTTEGAEEKVICFVILCFCLAFNCISKVWANRFASLCSVFKIIALITIIGIGFYYISKGKAEEWKHPFVMEGFRYKEFFSAWINTYWAHEGWNSIISVSGDMKNPRRDIPISIVVSLLIVMFLNVSIVVSYSAVLGYTNATITETAALDVAQIVLGKYAPFMSIMVCISSLGAAIGSFYVGGQVGMSAGLTSDLPSVFSLIFPRQRTPVISLFFIFLISLFFVPFDFQKLLIYCSCLAWSFYTLSFICAIIMKVKKRFHVSHKHFSVPMPVIFPILIASPTVVLMCFVLKPVGCSVLVSLALGLYGIKIILQKLDMMSHVQRYNNYLIRRLESWFHLTRATLEDIT